MPAPRFVLLDRDGVINVNIQGDYILNADMLELLPGAAEAIAELNRAGIEIVVASNQQCVGKGLLSAADLDALTRELEVRIRAESGGAIREFLYCTDLANTGSLRRKPEPGMLFDAQAKYGFDPAATYFLGDSFSDIEAAKRAGCRAIFLLGGNDDKRYHAGDPLPMDVPVVADLAAAVPIICGIA
jgi:D-glycero-D-manno-heptose 1,7-bisphosphate phosphatase